MNCLCVVVLHKFFDLSYIMCKHIHKTILVVGIEIIFITLQNKIFFNEKFKNYKHFENTQYSHC